MTLNLPALIRARDIFEAVCGEAPDALTEAIQTARISGKIEIKNGKPVPAWTGYVLQREDGRYYQGLHGFGHWTEKPENAALFPDRKDADCIADRLHRVNVTRCKVLPANRVGENTRSSS